MSRDPTRPRLSFVLGPPRPSDYFGRPTVVYQVMPDPDLEAHGMDHPMCGDCACPATEMITERSGVTWFWCGVCFVGG